ncbi:MULTISPECIES: hypothetical protein [Streptomyces]|uniref:DUF559 domain-containing protein n=1 Tax=Streptomyces glycanivorans TaxID=3033808 RepID=A0ABY9JFD9_9ACTN|nr:MULTISPECIES: hypothetical protein [unclassified Streptomyces]WSQ79886.1 hypothetical protein OG725_23535 [Streptomyces sp. NBC_01213]WLQ66435.1 hypothetical protein P8A20_23940 [Streptomyces sp. Alt3]WSQ87266.1 hypothetical protein OG722_24220 [Streptomyces sp. NBC_01212]WSR06718.1 hypothetical protein OG265_12205 [Streptomyces sp. NBC_01208]WSR50544.1 hypothetical protein OG279_24225 [Streptomyces sp. NBC_01201]
MTQNAPLPPRPVHEAARRVQSAAQLRARGVTAAHTAAQCLPGGPWQQLLPSVYLLHRGAPTNDDRVRGALLYAGRPPAGTLRTVPAQHGPGYGESMVTGLAALALYGFTSAPPMIALHRIDVLVPRTRRLRSTRFVQVTRAAALPRPQRRRGVPLAPVERALADAVASLTDAPTVRRILTEAVRGGHCEPGSVVRELGDAKLLGRAHVVDAVEALLIEGRAAAEDRLYGMVRAHGLPQPLWNVELSLPGGGFLGGVDAYWPEQAVALEIGARSPREERVSFAAEREHLERLGVTVVRVTPKQLRESAAQQSVVLRTAMMAAEDREPAAYVVVLPR